MLNREFKTKWVKALRSGRYKQTHGVLVDSVGRRCCLGVGCAVLGLRKTRGGAYRDDSVRGTSSFNGMTFPTPRQLKAMGLSRVTARRLGELNDNDGLSFSEIADYIERRLK